MSENVTAEAAHELLRASEADIQKKLQLEAKVAACTKGTTLICQSGLSLGLVATPHGLCDRKRSRPSWAEEAAGTGKQKGYGTYASNEYIDFKGGPGTGSANDGKFRKVSENKSENFEEISENVGPLCRRTYTSLCKFRVGEFFIIHAFAKEHYGHADF